ncbi:hypothetical protein POM88_008556 [Heracleum sosnowskyi]|uniref:Peptide chain release factor domain-containing protein n=1 Tax=Heracleum sosnowskyi TaxID=360622 RepID=A0AAD8J7E9_9APIA|nr:hypothetical protein POM88_008556 [Heracleum sosnowskyi]
MLLWAVDNPAPANFLLISGDRDFSNALDQLRMRRYNILLAQPPRASAALVAAAESVWHWATLLSGGFPFATGGLSWLGNNSNNSQPAKSQGLAQDTSLLNKPASLYPKNVPSSNLRLIGPAVAGDATEGGNNFLKVKTYPPLITKALSADIKERNKTVHTAQPENAPARQFNRAPHEFFGINKPVTPESILQLTQPFSLDKLGISSFCTSEVPPVILFSSTTKLDNSIGRAQGCQHPSDYIEGLIGVVLLALHHLKLEKLIPSEANIKDCIRYGDPKFHNTDVKKALDFALERQMISKQNLGGVYVYVGRIEKLWKCVDTAGGNQDQYPKATWDGIWNFLSSSAGHSSMMASECRYEEGMILKNSCLKDLSLGEVLHLLNMIITLKRWIMPTEPGWQPITITVAAIEILCVGMGIRDVLVRSRNIFKSIQQLPTYKFCISPYCTELHPQFSSDLVNIMERKLSAIQHRSAYLQGLVSQPEASPHECIKANKELRKLSASMELINELRAKQKEIEDLKALKSECQEDKGMQDMVLEELGQSMEEEKRLQNVLLKSLLPKDDADERDSILEVRAGTGGEEASLFAMDIFKMYERYSQKSGWKFEIVDITGSDLKGFKEASAAISGADVYGKLKFESGIHRVQRVPTTEKSGRVHTSAVSVAILPQADEVDVHLKTEDLRIDTYRSGGSGGQHANTTNSAVRITHLPSGLTVAIQDERSQHMNKAKALKVLCAKLYELERSRISLNRSKLRMAQIGSGDRSERIRTYNFPQGRVTDHRVGITHHSIQDVMEGENLDVFIDALLLQQEMNALASFGST